jgi:hypothetical protein
MEVLGLAMPTYLDNPQLLAEEMKTTTTVEYLVGEVLGDGSLLMLDTDHTYKGATGALKHFRRWRPSDTYRLVRVTTKTVETRKVLKV